MTDSGPRDEGIPLGLSDQELRVRSNLMDKEQVTYQIPSDGFRQQRHDMPIDHVLHPPRGSKVGLPQEEATKALTDFMNSNSHSLFMDFRQDNPKGGKSRARYEKYKGITTRDEYEAAIKRGYIKGSLASYRGGDAINDLQHGFLKIVAKKSIHQVAALATSTTSTAKPPDSATVKAADP